MMVYGTVIAQGGGIMLTAFVVLLHWFIKRRSGGMRGTVKLLVPHVCKSCVQARDRVVYLCSRRRRPHYSGLMYCAQLPPPVHEVCRRRHIQEHSHFVCLPDCRAPTVETPHTSGMRVHRYHGSTKVGRPSRT